MGLGWGWQIGLLLLLHWPNPQVPLAETLQALAKVKELGLARYIGLSASTLAKMRCRGDGPNYVKLGLGAIGYRIADLNAYTQSRIRRAVKEMK